MTKLGRAQLDRFATSFCEGVETGAKGETRTETAGRLSSDMTRNGALTDAVWLFSARLSSSGAAADGRCSKGCAFAGSTGSVSLIATFCKRRRTVFTSLSLSSSVMIRLPIRFAIVAT